MSFIISLFLIIILSSIMRLLFSIVPTSTSTQQGPHEDTNCVELARSHIKEFMEDRDYLKAFNSIIGIINAVGKSHRDYPTLLCFLAEVEHLTGAAGCGEHLLDNAIGRLREALKVEIQDQDEQAKLSNTLMEYLEVRFALSAKTTDLTESIEIAIEAVGALPRDHPFKVDRQKFCGSLFTKLFLEINSDQTLLDKKLPDYYDLIKKAKQNGAQDAAGALSLVINLGTVLYEKYKTYGTNLDHAIQAFTEAVKMTPPGYHAEAHQLSSFSYLLHRRYERSKSTEDLDKAIEYSRRAAAATFPGNISDQAGRWGSLTSLLSIKFENTQSLDDLVDAAKCSSKAAILTPLYHADRETRCTSNADLLVSLWSYTQSSYDRQHAIEGCIRAIEALPLNHLDRATRGITLETLLSQAEFPNGSE